MVSDRIFSRRFLDGVLLCISLIEADKVALLPGILKLPIKRHFIYPKDKVALSGITLCVNLLETAAQFIVSHYLSEHMGEYYFKEAKVLELFSCHESILPSTVSSLGPVIGYDSYASTSFRYLIALPLRTEWDGASLK